MQNNDMNLLADMDLGRFSENERQTIAQNTYAKLEERVGEKVAVMVPDDKFEQFEQLVDQADDEKLDEWLDINVPDYESLVTAELDNIKSEFRTDPDAFLKPLTLEL